MECEMSESIINGIFTLGGVFLGAILTIAITKLTAAGGIKIFLKRIKIRAITEKNDNCGHSIFLDIKDIKDNAIKYFEIRFELLVTNTSTDFKSLNYLRIGIGSANPEPLKDDDRTRQEIYGLVTHDADNFCFQGKSTVKLRLRAFIYNGDVKIFDDKYFYLIYSNSKNITKKLKLSFDKFDIDKED